MKQISYTDADGFRHAVLLPDGAPESAAPMGVPVGPLPLDGLDLPLELRRAINNELHDRALWGPDEIRRRRQDAALALIRAYRVGVEEIEALWTRGGDGLASGGVVSQSTGRHAKAR